MTSSPFSSSIIDSPVPESSTSSSTEVHGTIETLPLPGETDWPSYHPSNSTRLTTRTQPTTTYHCTNNSTSCETSTSAITPTTLPTTTSESCIPLDDGVTKTTISFIYTSTTTFFGNSTDYTAPFPPPTLPPYCDPTSLPAPPPPEFPAPPLPSEPGSATFPVITRTKAPQPTFTFITTEKNPSVVFSTGPIPGFTSPNANPPHGSGEHKTVVDPKPGDTKAPGIASPRPTFTVTARPSQVIISDSTFGDLKPDQTKTVTVGHGTFTIFPTAVIGEGATVEKPVPADPTPDFVPSPTSTNIGGLPISISDSVAVVDGRTITIPSEGIATTINGEHLSLGRGTAVVASDNTFTWPVPPSQRTDLVVAGADMLTAIGSSILVVHSTTITYGPDGVESSTLTVDDDTITIAPEGILIHGSTLGGPSAANTDTKYEVVGGVTVTKVGSTLIAIDDKTYTIGDDTEVTTTSFGGEEITIGPDGAVVGSMTFNGKDSDVVTTIEATGTYADEQPTETGQSSNSEDEDEDDAGMALRPSSLLLVCFCITAGHFLLF